MDIKYRKLRDFYSMKPNAKIVQQEFGFYSLDKWISDGYISKDTDLAKLFGYDDNAVYELRGLGWCEAEFCPFFEEKVLEDRGDYELVRDYAGRDVLFFKGRRNGFMPEYINSPVKDEESWERDVKWRLNPSSSARFAGLDKIIHDAKSAEAEGAWIRQNIIGGYMYLRSLFGPEKLLYAFYDTPELIHDCMRTWFELADKVISAYQSALTLDEVFFAEDICYNHGCLISSDMMNEFLFPYYQQLVSNIKSRQIDTSRRLVVQVDTDGNCLPVIDIYREKIGMNYMSPFEVAAGCDVTKVRGSYPDLLIRGGIDKRILASGREAIAREIDRIMPFMTKYGGYIPCCDHGVPEEVPFEDYMYYRELMKSF